MAKTLTFPDGQRLAKRATPITTGAMERFLRKLGISGTQYQAWAGNSLKEWVAMNPKWSLRKWQELMLENLDAFQPLN